MKYLKYSWGFNEDGSEKYAIVQELDQESTEVEVVRSTLQECGFDERKEAGVFSKMVYGSRAKYSKRGEVLYFSDPVKITELDTDEVIKEHFVGLI